MKQVLIFAICFILLMTLSNAQTVKEILQSSSDSLHKISKISYKVSLQSYLNGSVKKNINGAVILEKSTDSIFGMKYIVITDSIEIIFDGTNAFEINHNKATVRQINPNGLKKNEFKELLINDLIYGYEKAAYAGSIMKSDDTSKYRVIAFSSLNESGSSVKKIFINSHTGFPERFESVWDHNGQKEVIEILLSDIAVGPKNIPRVDNRIVRYLDKYSLLPVEDIGISYTLNARDSLSGKQAPDFTLKSLNDRSVSLSDFKGKLVLLDFWEVWCGPCRMSMPHLQELHHKFNEKGLVILGITSGNIMAARGLLANRKVTYENLAGTDKVSRDYKVQEIPQYFLIDENGIIIYVTKTGFEKSLEDMIIQRIKHEDSRR